MASSCSSCTIPILSLPTLTKPTCSISNRKNNARVQITVTSSLSSRAVRTAGGGGGGTVWARACYTSAEPLTGKVGWHRREGNLSLLSFGIITNHPPPPSNDEVDDRDRESSSQSLSSLLPFVVAVTAVAALSRPSTFSWLF